MREENMTTMIEVRTRKGDPSRSTTRRVFLNGLEIPGIRKLNVRNKAGNSIDFLEVSLTFLVREEDLLLTNESLEEHSQ